MEGNICNRLSQLNTAIVRGLTCCKTLARHWASRKIWSRKFPPGGGKPYPASGIHGITITDNIDWGQHVSEISYKATKTLGFLRRNLAFAPRSTKGAAYKTLVQPKLEYVAPIWSPHSKLQINQIEEVQRTAARWTCKRWRNTSSVGEMLDELEWPSLEARRDQSSMLLFHKIHCGAVSIEKYKYITPAHSLKTTRSPHSAQYRRHQTHVVMPWRIPYFLNYSTLE